MMCFIRSVSFAIILVYILHIAGIILTKLTIIFQKLLFSDKMINMYMQIL